MNITKVTKKIYIILANIKFGNLQKQQAGILDF